MHPYHLEVFCKVVECGSFSRAAAELFVTQPAVSQHVKALERELGQRLFSRGPGELALTEAGRVVYRYAQQILATQKEMRRLLAAVQDGSLGRVFVGASSTGVLYYLPLLLRHFRAVNPGVEVVLTSDITDQLRTAVAEGELDVGLVWGPVADPRLRTTPLHRAPFVVIASPDHPLARRTEVSPSDLADQPFIMNLPGTTTRLFVEATLRAVGITPRVTTEGRSTENIKKVVESGLGLAVVARRAVELELAFGSLAVLNVAGFPVEREIALIVRQSDGLPPAVLRFVEFVRSSRALFAAQEPTPADAGDLSGGSVDKPVSAEEEG